MLTTTQSYVTYQGNGATIAFPYNFLVQQAGHLVVSITNNNVSPAATTVLTASQYSATGIGNGNEFSGGSGPGGTLTYPLTGNPLPLGWSITIQRIVPYQQNTSLTNQGAFYPQVVEAALDTLTMLCQQLADVLALGSLASNQNNISSIVIGGQWLLAVDSSGELSIQHWEGGQWVEKSAITV